jgi:hypothetical protein
MANPVTTPEMKLLLRMEGIYKHFPGVQALSDVKFDLRHGEVAIVAHDQTSRTGIDRVKGFTNEVKSKYPNITMVDTRYGGGDQLKSTDITEAIIQNPVVLVTSAFKPRTKPIRANLCPRRLIPASTGMTRPILTIQRFELSCISKNV